MNEIVGRLRLNIFCFKGSTITTSLGRRKYASEERIFLSCRLILNVLVPLSSIFGANDQYMNCSDYRNDNIPIHFDIISIEKSSGLSLHIACSTRSAASAQKVYNLTIRVHGFHCNIKDIPGLYFVIGYFHREPFFTIGYGKIVKVSEFFLGSAGGRKQKDY
jgi:hypothetical protein